MLSSRLRKNVLHLLQRGTDHTLEEKETST